MSHVGIAMGSCFPPTRADLLRKCERQVSRVREKFPQGNAEALVALCAEKDWDWDASLWEVCLNAPPNLHPTSSQPPNHIACSGTLWDI